MAEPQKGKTSSVDPKQKNSLFDDDIGKDFMTSWKSLSVAGDDNMDFSFDTVSTGKKKKMNFDKIDMDFDLNGDFDKLTSFKMPDLDFTSPSKKTSKLKESSKEESSSGNHHGKKENFGCSFDFNEFDDFNFDSPIIRGKTSVKNSESEKVGSEGGEIQRPKVNLACSDDAFDYCHTEKSRSPEVATSVVVTTVLGAATGISSNDNSPSIEKYGDMIMSHNASNPPEKTVSASAQKSNKLHFLDEAMPEEETVSAGAEKADQQSYSLENAMLLERTVSASAEKADQQNHFLQKAIISTGAEKSDLQNQLLEKAIPTEKVESAIAEKVDQQTHFRDKAMPIEKTVSACVEKADQQSHFPEKVTPIESHSQKTTQISPVESVNGNNPIQDMELDVQVGSLAGKFNIESSAEENVTDSTVDGVGSNHENLQLKNLALLYSNESEGNGGSFRKENSENPTGIMTGAELIRADFDFETTSTANLLQKKPQDSNDIQKSASKNLVSLRSEPVVNNVTPTKDQKLEVVCSRFFKRSKEPEPQPCQPSSTGMEVSSFGCQGNARRESFNVKDAETDKKVTGDSRSLSVELTKGGTSLLGTDKNLKNLLNVREDFNSSEKQNVHKLITNPRPPERKVPKGDCGVVGSGVNIKILNNLGTEVNTSSSTVKATKSSTISSVNLKAAVSSMATTGNLKMISVGALQAVKKTPDLASLKIARPSGASKDHSNAVVKRGLISLRNSEKSVHPVANAERNSLLVTSLKRKTHEASTPELVSLYPQKRLSPSPNQIRHLKESLKSTVEEQVCNHDSQAKSQANDVLRNNLTFGLEKPRLANIREQDISLAMENDGNVEKAEAYAKELDDICKMLEKKHDEAKDLMVRAIVNNNSLLMLDHPMFNEKIQNARKFATQLISNCRNKMI